LIGGLFVYRKAWSLWRRFALVMRGQAGKNRLYLLVLADYVFSLLMLGAAAVLFWTMLVKLAAAQGDSSLTAFFRICLSYFLAGIKSPVTEPSLPFWMQIGCSITAFVLFVLFVGAAASLLPYRFSAYAERLDRRYRIARKFALSFKRTTKALENARYKLHQLSSQDKTKLGG
jgi:hypothetical protein